jgi:hypothetical protein
MLNGIVVTSDQSWIKAYVRTIDLKPSLTSTFYQGIHRVYSGYRLHRVPSELRL